MRIRQSIKKWFVNTRAVRKLVNAVVMHTNNNWPAVNPSLNTSTTALIKKYRGWVYACAHKNGQAVANVPLRLYVTTRSGERAPRTFTREVDPQQLLRFNNPNRPYIHSLVRQAKRVEEVLDHPYLDLMRTANPIMDGVETLELLQVYQELIGDSYLLKVRDKLRVVREIWPLLAHHVEIVPDSSTLIKHYLYGRYAGRNRTTYQPDEVVHFRMPNPESYYYGMPPLRAAAISVGLQDNMDGYEQGLFGNQARPDQVLIPEQPIHRSARVRMEKEFNEAARGITRAGKTIVVPYGVRLQPLNFSPKELSYLMGRKTTRDDIASIFDIPAVLLSPDQGNRGKDEAAEYMHAKYGIWPRCRRMEQRLNQDLVSEYDSRLFCAFDDPVPKDKEFALKKRTADLRSGNMVINEVREIDGKSSVPWGNEPLLPSNIVPLSESVTTMKSKRDVDKAKAKALLLKTKAGDDKGEDKRPAGERAGEPEEDVVPGRTRE